MGLESAARMNWETKSVRAHTLTLIEEHARTLNGKTNMV